MEKREILIRAAANEMSALVSIFNSGYQGGAETNPFHVLMEFNKRCRWKLMFGSVMALVLFTFALCSLIFLKGNPGIILAVTSSILAIVFLLRSIRHYMYSCGSGEYLTGQHESKGSIASGATPKSLSAQTWEVGFIKGYRSMSQMFGEQVLQGMRSNEAGLIDAVVDQLVLKAAEMLVARVLCLQKGSAFFKQECRRIETLFTDMHLTASSFGIELHPISTIQELINGIEPASPLVSMADLVCKLRDAIIKAK